MNLHTEDGTLRWFVLHNFDDVLSVSVLFIWISTAAFLSFTFRIITETIKDITSVTSNIFHRGLGLWRAISNMWQEQSRMTKRFDDLIGSNSPNIIWYWLRLHLYNFLRVLWSPYWVESMIQVGCYEAYLESDNYIANIVITLLL